MKRTYLLLFAAALLALGCSRVQPFTVATDLESARLPQGDAVLITSELLQKPVEAPVKDGAFTAQGKVEKPAFATLKVAGAERESTRPLILEKGTISFEEGFAVGTPLNNSNRDFVLRVREIRKTHNGQPAAMKEALDAEFIAYVTRHKDDPCAIFAIMLANRRISSDVVQQMIGITSPEIRNNGEIRSLSDQLKKKEMYEKMMNESHNNH